MASLLNRGKGFKPRAERMARGTVGLKRTPFERGAKGHYGLRRDAKKALGTKEPEPGSRKDLEDRLESLNAKRVKMEAGYQCKQCAFDGAPTFPPLDAGHIYPKGKFPGGKYIYANLAAQCRRHNLLHVRRPEFMFLWYDAAHGEGSLTKLHALVLAQPRRQSIEWLTQKIKESEEAIAEMELLAVA